MDHSPLNLKVELPTPNHQPNNLLICHEWDNTIRWQPGERLHHLFERRCDQFLATGDTQHLAVDSLEDQWKYRELDERANQLAHYLSIQGHGAGDIIGLLFDKSVHGYVSMLAVLKINAAYVPLDPAFPEDRIAYIGGDSGMKSILTISQYLSLTDTAGLPVVCMDTESALINEQSKTRPGEQEVGQPVSELCYIIYTSGSTGRPKGVPIDQASICNFVRVAAEVYGYKSSDRVYQGLTIAFDFAVEEIWVPLVVGATLLPNRTGSSLLGSDLANFLRENRATAMCCVPTLLATIDEALPDLRLLIVSGEACPQDLITRWYSPECTILNAYGPTETTVTATLARPRPGEPVTIGKPLPTYSVIILEPGTENVLPFGQEGEIAIAGVGVARGYLNRDDQTKKAFIEDFLNIENNPSGLIYRTGDLGLINGNGDIEYRGRIDLQVKIRGYRIELTEIESVLLQMPQIAQAVVDTFESLPGNKELVAYYTLKDNTAPLQHDEILTELRSLLPNYMVPAYYEELAIMPMMASDKVDRKKLPRPSNNRIHGEQREFVAPDNTLEKEIAGVLNRTLKLDTVSVTDNFFDDLGANSLLMAQFSAKLRSELGIADFSMREIYIHPSVRELAASLDSSTKKWQPKISDKPVHKAKAWHYALTGVAQLVIGYALLYLGAFIFWEGFNWIMDAPGMQTAFRRSILFTGSLFAIAFILPVSLKWILIGRFKPEEFPVWTLKHFNFWTVKMALTANPMRAFVGSPIFIAYLKLLGARISWNCNIQTSTIPVAVDLLTIGDGAVISQNVNISGYRAESGYIKTGSVTIERDTFVGAASVLGINTVMEAGSELAHASSLHEGQRLKAGVSYHGSPAQPAKYHYRQLESGRVSIMRKLIYSLVLVLPMFIFLPLLFLIPHYFLGAELNGLRTPLAEFMPETKLSHISITLIWSAIVFVTLLPVGLLSIMLSARLFNLFLQEDKVYTLYGIHYILHGLVRSISNSKFYNYMFGDSSFIVYFLRFIGYKFKGLIQTGSNFGMEQKHENPFLCEIGKGTMVSDGITMVNTTYSASSFKLSKVRISPNGFLGNALVFPAESKVGENCLLGTKSMVPTHGASRENTGLLGSPCFEIPRSVRRDKQFDRYKQKDVLRKRLKLKNAHNLVTIALFLLVNFIPIFLTINIIWFTLPLLFKYQALYIATLFFAMPLWVIPYYILVERASLLFRRLKPMYCSIYDENFWKHERFWKISAYTDTVIRVLNGTPFKSLAWRAGGVKVGKRLFDDGASTSEQTLLEIGDYCTLNPHAFIQPHSLEDGAFKSDHVHIGNECTLGTSTFIHYGTFLEDGVVIEPDSFLMKGERPDKNSIWQGNPAKALLRELHNPDI